MIAETIIKETVEMLIDLNIFKTIERKIPDYDNIKNIPAVNMPIACVNSFVPLPIYENIRQAQNKTVLEIDINVYALDNETPDSRISEFIFEIWKGFNAYKYSPPTLERRLIDGDKSIMPPFTLLNLKLEFQYTSTKLTI